MNFEMLVIFIAERGVPVWRAQEIAHDYLANR